MAMSVGKLSPPPVKPLPESGLPLELNSLTVLLK